MAWLRSGDNNSTHPIVVKVLSLVRRSKKMVLERDVAVCEVYGFVMLCASESAGHWQDYAISEGTALRVSPYRADRLLQLAERAGYLTKEVADGVVAYRLVDDPNFIHMIKKGEKAWKDQQKADNGNDALVKVVRARDGDSCRYCYVIVNWDDRVGGRGGTYDHRYAGEKAESPEDLVVACRSCNGARRDRDDPDDTEADQVKPLRPVPAHPYYSVTSAEFLAKRGIDVEPSEALRPGQYLPDTARTGSDPATAGPRADAGDSDPDGGTASPTESSDPNRGTADSTESSDPAEGTADSTDGATSTPTATSDLQVAAGRQTPGASRTGTGRVGSGREPRLGPGPPGRSRRRSRRGKRPPPDQDPA